MRYFNLNHLSIKIFLVSFFWIIFSYICFRFVSVIISENQTFFSIDLIFVDSRSIHSKAAEIINIYNNLSDNQKNIVNFMSIIDKLEGPNNFPISPPRFEAFLRPINLKIQNKEITLINSKKYLIVGIGINTVYAPKSSQFKSISLSQCSNKKIDNKSILNDLKRSYEKLISDIKEYKLDHLKKNICNQ